MVLAFGHEPLQVHHVVSGRDEGWLFGSVLASLTHPDGGEEAVADALACFCVLDLAALGDKVFRRFCRATVAHRSIVFAVSLS